MSDELGGTWDALLRSVAEVNEVNEVPEVCEGAAP